MQLTYLNMSLIPQAAQGPATDGLIYLESSGDMSSIDYSAFETPLSACDELSVVPVPSTGSSRHPVSMEISTSSGERAGPKIR